MRVNWNIVALLSVLLIGAAGFAVANGTHVEEETGLGHELEELNPLFHFSEGHAFSGIVLAVLWASFLYAAFTLYKALKK